MGDPRWALCVWNAPARVRQGKAPMFMGDDAAKPSGGNNDEDKHLSKSAAIQDVVSQTIGMGCGALLPHGGAQTYQRAVCLVVQSY